MKIENGILFDVNNSDIDENGYFNFPSNVFEIGYEAFSSCTKLLHLYIPDSIKKIDETFLTDCAKLESISFPADFLWRHIEYGLEEDKCEYKKALSNDCRYDLDSLRYIIFRGHSEEWNKIDPEKYFSNVVIHCFDKDIL